MRITLTRRVLFIVALVLGATNAHAQAPRRVSSDRLDSLVAAFNTGDTAVLRGFIQSHFAKSFIVSVPIATHLMVLGHMYEASGGWTDVRIVAADDTSATATLRHRLNGTAGRLVLLIERDAPNGIRDLSASTVSEPRSQPTRPPGSNAEVMATLGAPLRRMESSDSMSGVVLVARGDSILFQEAFGLADRNWSVRNTIDTRFNIASMGKMFTAVAVARLVEQGKIEFEAPISRYLGPMLPNALADRIQVRHLLSHTSGLGDYFSDPRWRNANRTAFRTVSDYTKLIAADSGSFAPGTRYSYSNSGYVLLGRIIEVTSGEAYDRFVNREVFQRAGMTRTAFLSLDSVTPSVAVGYVRHIGRGGEVRWENNLFEHVVTGGPAGGAFSTARDLHRFARSLQNGQLVSPVMARTLFAPKTELGAQRYGFGFSISDSARVRGHSGGFPGIVGNLDIFDRGGYITVVLSNLTLGHSAGGAGWAIEELRHQLRDKD